MTPEPPIKISKEARKIWAKVYKLFSEFTDVKEADLFLLCRYSEAAAEYERIISEVSGRDCYQKLKSAKGAEYNVYDPRFIRMEKISAQMLRMEKQLGLARKDSNNTKAKVQDTDRSKLYRAK
jgi:P27 family predicted phage terminase small subunit